jgi:hypothetical protein
MPGDSLSIGRLEAGPKPSPLWRRDVTDVLLAAAVLLTLALISFL